MQRQWLCTQTDVNQIFNNNKLEKEEDLAQITAWTLIPFGAL